MRVFYGELAPWWPLVSPVDEYRGEAAEFLRVLEAAHPSARTLLELGSGGGHNACYLKGRYAATLTDLSPEMLEVSIVLNPECRHIAGDMRSLRLGEEFDVVFVHDAIDYMRSEADLAAAMATAHAHCHPGGVALFVPDQVRERYAPDTDCGGSDGLDGRGVRYLVWSYDPDPDDSVIMTQYVFALRDADGSVRTLREEHTIGLFSREAWCRLLEEQGFDVEVVEEQTEEDHTPRLLFLARKPAPQLPSAPVGSR